MTDGELLRPEEAIAAILLDRARRLLREDDVAFCPHCGARINPEGICSATAEYLRLYGLLNEGARPA